MDPPYTASDLGYCIELNPTTFAKKNDECWADGVDYYDEDECCGADGSWCNGQVGGDGTAWHWCEKTDPIDYCEGSCFQASSKTSPTAGE